MRSIILFGLMTIIANTLYSQNKYPYHFKYDGNPLSRIHTATDPDVHVWNDTVWMYCSQDHQAIDGNIYASMDGYHAFSSSDLVNWTDHGEVFHSSMLKAESWGPIQSGWMWAPGAARKKDANGVWTYYLYYPHNKAAKGAGEDWVTGVATAPHPWGPFTDQGILGGYPGWKAAMDPMVFVDDDGKAYIYANSAKVAKLNPDMVSLAEEPRAIDYAPEAITEDKTVHFGEGSYMHKKEGVYYYSYSNFNNNKYQGFYAMGNSPYGPFTWKGGMAPAPASAQDHHSVIEFKGQWYYFYHISVPGFPLKKEGHGRIACFDRLYYNKDGSIQMVVHTAGPTNILKTNAPNGSVVLDPPGGAYAKGQKVTLTATGDLGFAFKSWSGDISGQENPSTMVMDADRNVTANFSVTPTYTVLVNSAHGKVLLDPPGGTYNFGTVVRLTPVKDFGHRFSSWSGDLSGSDSIATITMNADKQITANFVSMPTYRIECQATNGIIELQPPGALYEKGSVISATAKPDFGYQFTGWEGDLSGLNQTAKFQMDADKKIKANFSYAGKGKIVFATNCGGKDFRSEEGVYYTADMNYQGGGTYSLNNLISGTSDDVLFQKERNGIDFGYTIALPNNDYQVTLLFAEIFHDSAGKRVFDVFIEGKKVSDQLDIYAKVGKNAAYQETHQAKVIDGELNISFVAKKDMAKISAIKIVLPDK
jgi:arabinoxylan arabinofuranohydrolase